MANRTDPLSAQIHSQDPQHLIEAILRHRIYDSMYWKEKCFGLTAETLIDRAIELNYIGSTFSHNSKATPFICLVLKLLQIQPDKEIIYEYINQDDYKYLRALGLLYIRLTCRPIEIYTLLEPFYNDYRKLVTRSVNGWGLTHMDEFVDELLTEERVLNIILPHIPKRLILTKNKLLLPRKSTLDYLINNNINTVMNNNSISEETTQISNNHHHNMNIQPISASEEGELPSHSPQNNITSTLTSTSSHIPSNNIYQALSVNSDRHDNSTKSHHHESVSDTNKEYSTSYDKHSSSSQHHNENNDHHRSKHHKRHRHSRSRSRSYSPEDRHRHHRRRYSRSRSRSPSPNNHHSHHRHHRDHHHHRRSRSPDHQTDRNNHHYHHEFDDKQRSSSHISSATSSINTSSKPIQRIPGIKYPGGNSNHNNTSSTVTNSSRQAPPPPEGSVEYWNQIRANLNMKPLRE